MDIPSDESCGFWINLPKAVRLKGIRIDGEEVAGLDYSALNPRLAYHIGHLRVSFLRTARKTAFGSFGNSR